MCMNTCTQYTHTYKLFICNFSCIPCPDGHFIDEVNTTCVRCPPGTVVYTHNAYGAESCKPCGKGLKPQNGKVCVTDGLYEDSQGNEYDLRNLSARYLVQCSR